MRVWPCAPSQSLAVALSVLALQATAQSSLPFPGFLSAVEESLNSPGKSTVADALASVSLQRSRFIDINYQQPDDSSQSGGWNAKYDLQYVYTAENGFSTKSGDASLSTLEARLDISGSYSFGNAVNNQDVSSAMASFAYVGGRFGAVPYASKDAPYDRSLAYQRCKGSLTTPQPDDDMRTMEAYARASQLCIAQASAADLFTPRGLAYAWELAVNAGVEGNQDYSDSHDVYGLSALVSARQWPSLRLDLEQVDASNNDQRRQITADDNYDRITVEAGYQYTIRAVQNLPITFSAGYRRFYEIDAPQEIREARLDQFDYWSASLRVPARMFRFIKSDDYSLYVRYTDGQLPFDRASDSAFEVGFSSNIALLAKLFE